MIYLYQTTDGKVHEVVMTVSERDKREKNGRIRIGGKIAKRRIDLEHGGFVDAAAKNWNPGKHQDNYALAVQPEQVAEYATHAKNMGVPTEFRKGSPQFTSLSHRRKYLKAFGKRDWSDYT